MRRTIDPELLREFSSTGRKLLSERTAAAQTVRPLLINTPRESWPTLAEYPHLQTCGTLDELSRIFTDTLATDPQKAHAVAELAVSVSEGLPEDAYPSIIRWQVRAHAWKDLGKALRYLGRNEEAVTIFHHADEILDKNARSLGHDRAIVRFNLAMSLQELERFNESLRLLAECKSTFIEFGDDRNAALCVFSEGVLLQRLRRFREAREVYLRLLATAPVLDMDTRAATHHAIGFSSIELGEFTDAEQNLRHAIGLYQQLGQAIDILKAEAGRGRLEIRAGNPQIGIRLLGPVRRKFLKHTLYEEAGLCGLEIVEAYLMLGQPSQAETLARTLVGEFTLAGLNTRAITALGYLSEAIAAQKAKPALANHVREYIISLRYHPEREFTPSYLFLTE